MSYAVFCIMMVFLVACFISCRFLKADKSAIFSKTMASLGMVVGAILILIYGYSYVCLYIIIGLICGMLGDIFLEFRKVYKQDSFIYFNSGMACFAVGHVMYIIAMLKMVIGANILLDVLVSAGVAIAFTALLFFVLAKPLKLEFGKCKWQSFAYSIELTFAMMLSVMLYIYHNTSIFMMLGLISFLLSDLVLSTQYFGGEEKEDNKLLVAVNHILYYGAQVLIIGVMYF